MSLNGKTLNGSLILLHSPSLSHTHSLAAIQRVNWHCVWNLFINMLHVKHDLRIKWMAQKKSLIEFFFLPFPGCFSYLFLWLNFTLNASSPWRVRWLLSFYKMALNFNSKKNSFYNFSMMNKKIQMQFNQHELLGNPSSHFSAHRFGIIFLFQKLLKVFFRVHKKFIDWQSP